MAPYIAMLIEYKKSIMQTPGGFLPFRVRGGDVHAEY